MIIDKIIKFRKSKILNKIIHRYCLRRGLDIPSSVILGKNVQFPHNSIGTVIHPNTRIGNNVKIYQNVTIGRSNVWEEPKKNFAGFVIEDGVIICAGAKIISSEETLVVGKNTIIGANAVLTRSTGENEIWVGIPAKKIKDRDL